MASAQRVYVPKEYGGDYSTDYSVRTLVDKGYVDTNISLQPIVSKNSDYTLTSTDHTVLVDASGGDVIITVPDSTSDTDLYNSTLGRGKVYIIKKTDSSTTNTVILQRSGVQEIEGDTSFTMQSPGEVVGLQTDGSDWFITAKFKGLYW